jgi:hypothetical protein
MLSGALTWSCAHKLFAGLAGSDHMLVRSALGGIAGCAFLLPFLFCVRPVSERWRMLRPGLCAAVAAVVLAPFIYLSLLGGLEFGAVSPGEWTGIALALLLAAAAEEVVFRLYLMDTLSFGGRSAIGITLSSILFAAAHAANPGADTLSIVNIGLFGVLLGLLRMVSRGIAAPILLHFLWNLATGMVLGWRVSGFELPSILDQSSPLWAGFGPESSPVLTVCLFAVSGALMVQLGRDGRRFP